MTILDQTHWPDLGASIAAQMARQRGSLGDRLLSAFVSTIEAGGVAPGERLPAERELAAQLDVSRSTLRQCLKDLARLGLVATRPGAGTVVVGRIPKALSRLSGFTEDMQLRGLTPVSRILDRQVGPASVDMAFRTGVALGTQMMTLVRLRSAGNEVLAYERAVVPIDTVGTDYDGTTSLYERMETRGARPVRILQSLEAKEAPKEIADLLNVRVGAAVLKIDQIGYSPTGSVVEDAVTWYRGDRYRYVGEIRG